MDLPTIRSGFVATGLPAELVDELLDAYVEAKQRFFLGDLRPGAVEGGRFAEAAFRILQHVTTGQYTAVGTTLPRVDSLVRTLESVPAANAADAVRIHIPRTLRLIYDIRNKRDVAHLGDGIDPNLQDASLVVANMDWVVAEMVRLHHQVDASTAQGIVETLVTRSVPVIEEIDGQPVILKDLRPREQALLMLYRAGASGASIEELIADLRVDRRDHLLTRLRRLDEQRLVLEHRGTGRFHLTAEGRREVEARRLHLANEDPRNTCI